MAAKKQEKAPEAEEPQGYNLSLMSLGQLKSYARLLESEIEDMRKHCNFYQKTEDEIVEMLRTADEELRRNEDEVLLKEAKLEKLKQDFLRRTRQKRELPEYMEHKSASDRGDLMSATEHALNDEGNRHLEETRRLHALLQEKDRELESLRVKIELARKELQEKNESDLLRLEEEQKRLLKESMERFEDILREAERDFREARETIQDEASEARIKGERDLEAACEAFKSRLQAYYQEVTRQDLDTIRKLKGAIRRQEKAIEATRQALQQARCRNARLKECRATTSRRPVPENSNRFDAEVLRVNKALELHNRTERLALENQGLEAAIKERLDQICSLREQFTVALERIRQSAERKVAILQRKLDFIVEEGVPDHAPGSESKSS